MKYKSMLAIFTSFTLALMEKDISMTRMTRETRSEKRRCFTSVKCSKKRYLAAFTRITNVAHCVVLQSVISSEDIGGVAR